VSDPYADVCVGELERLREKALSALNTLTGIKSLVRKVRQCVLYTGSLT